MFSRVKEQHLKLRDIQMDYITFGRGKKTLIMIQGLNTRGIKGAGISLAFLYRIFAKEYTVYLFDRRSAVYDGITVRDMATDIAAAMDALFLTNADILGVSQGGMIAQYLAIERPNLVNKLVLAVTLSRNNDTVRAAIHHWIELTAQGRTKELTEDMARKLYSHSYVKKYQLFLPLLALLQKPKDPDRFIVLAKSCLTCSAYDQLDRIHCPVFVIGGRQDRIVGPEASEEIAAKLKCKLHMYEDLGHAAYEEAADFNRRVYDFLKG